MNFFTKTSIQAFICILVSSFFALAIPTFMSVWIKPILDNMMQSAIALGLNQNPDTANFPSVINYAACATAFVLTGFLIFLYYHTQHLIPGKSKCAKLFFVTAIIFIIKEDLIRQPIMDITVNYVIGFNNSLLFVILKHTDKWLANLFLAICLVYLCPTKKRTENLRTNKQNWIGY